MLTKVAGKWVDPSRVEIIADDSEGTCKVFFHRDSVPLYLDATADVVAAMVNAATTPLMITGELDPAAVEAFKTAGGKPTVHSVPSDATMTRIETLQNLLEEMDDCDNPDAAECWTHIRSHIKGKLDYWKIQAGQADQVKAPTGPLYQHYHQGQQDALTAAECRLRELWQDGDCYAAVGIMLDWFEARMAEKPRKIFSKRPAFSPEQLEESKAKAQRVGFLAAASWINSVLHEAVERLTPVQVNTGLAHNLHAILNDDDALGVKLTTGLLLMQQAANERKQAESETSGPEVK